jgi:citronellyl-CoA synthetase
VVENVLGAFPGVEDAVVYGVEIPGTNGRCGMAALRLSEGQQLNDAALATHLDAELPVYAAPLFIRLLGEVETTGTFKYKKSDLKQAAYNPAAIQEPLWVRLPGEQRFTPLDHSLFNAISEQAYRF